MKTDLFARHIKYSAAYRGACEDSTVPANAGRATKTIEKRRMKYGPKAASAGAIERARNQ